jgi:hypothetical protein
MATEAPWEVIRAAADRLEELAGKATPWPWRDDAGDGYVTAEWSEGDETTWETVADTTAANGAWIAALSPAVAEPLVAWLRYIARRIEVESRIFTTASQREALAGKHSHPIALARAILGEEQQP